MMMMSGGPKIEICSENIFEEKEKFLLIESAEWTRSEWAIVFTYIASNRMLVSVNNVFAHNTRRIFLETSEFQSATEKVSSYRACSPRISEFKALIYIGGCRCGIRDLLVRLSV